MSLFAAMTRMVLVTLAVGAAATASSAPQPNSPPPPPPELEVEPTPPPAPPQRRSPRATEDGFEPPPWRRTRISVAPLPTVVLSPNFEVEQAVSTKLSLYVSPRVSLAGLLLGAALGLDIGWAAELVGGVRYFPLEDDRAPGGFWLAGELGLGGGVILGLSLVTVVPQVVAGYTWIHESGFAFAGGLGGGLQMLYAPGNAQPLLSLRLADSLFLSPRLSVHLNVGYAF